MSDDIFKNILTANCDTKNKKGLKITCSIYKGGVKIEGKCENCKTNSPRSSLYLTLETGDSITSNICMNCKTETSVIRKTYWANSAFSFLIGVFLAILLNKYIIE